LALFGPPRILEGEDAGAYDELLGRLCAAVKPVDIIEEMFVVDLLDLQWEVMRLRRVKSSLLKASGEKALQAFLPEVLDFELCKKSYEARLTEVLRPLSKGQPDGFVENLAHDYIENDPASVQKVDKVLAPEDFEEIRDLAKVETVQELMKAYVRRKPGAITQVAKILASNNHTMDDLMASALNATSLFITMERIDGLISDLERRRNTSLREMHRHREALGRAMRQNVQQIEEGDYETIETKPVSTKAQHDQQPSDPGQPR